MSDDDPRFHEARRFERDAPYGCLLVVKAWVFYAILSPIILVAFLVPAHWLDTMIRQPTWRDPQVSIIHLLGLVAAGYAWFRLFRLWMGR